MNKDEYVIPVKIELEPGRYKHGYVKTLTPNSRGNLRIRYAGGRISERKADTVIYEPHGFAPRVCPECGSDTEHYLICSKSEL